MKKLERKNKELENIEIWKKMKKNNKRRKIGKHEKSGKNRNSRKNMTNAEHKEDGDPNYLCRYHLQEPETIVMDKSETAFPCESQF